MKKALGLFSSPDGLILASNCDPRSLGSQLGRLPAVDIHPHFRYLDELEDLQTEARRKRAIQQHKKRQEDVDRALIESVSTAAYRKGCARDLGPGNEQRFAILQMLQDDRD